MSARKLTRKQRALPGGFVGSRSVAPRFTTEYSSCCTVELPVAAAPPAFHPFPT
jgi:hypothetical protein